MVAKDALPKCIPATRRSTRKGKLLDIILCNESLQG
jgi:hypothetical protein